MNKLLFFVVLVIFLGSSYSQEKARSQEALEEENRRLREKIATITKDVEKFREDFIRPVDNLLLFFELQLKKQGLQKAVSSVAEKDSDEETVKILQSEFKSLM